MDQPEVYQAKAYWHDSLALLGAHILPLQGAAHASEGPNPDPRHADLYGRRQLGCLKRAVVTARTPPLRGYVGQRSPHKLVITARRNHIASQWMAPDEFDPMSPRHPEERSIERDESRDVGMTASVKVHHDKPR
jgi:hypothetical protein